MGIFNCATACAPASFAFDGNAAGFTEVSFLFCYDWSEMMRWQTVEGLKGSLFSRGVFASVLDFTSSVLLRSGTVDG